MLKTKSKDENIISVVPPLLQEILPLKVHLSSCLLHRAKSGFNTKHKQLRNFHHMLPSLLKSHLSYLSFAYHYDIKIIPSKKYNVNIFYRIFNQFFKKSIRNLSEIHRNLLKNISFIYKFQFYLEKDLIDFEEVCPLQIYCNGQ